MRRVRRTQDGMTLIEVIISVVILTLITGGITTSMLTALNIFSPTSHRVHETNDARLIASFLSRDAQAAGGSDPNTASLDTTNNLGVSTTNAAGCVNGTGTLVLRFRWFDRTPTVDSDGQQNVVAHVANYYFVASANQLVRTTCDSGPTARPPSSATLGTPTNITLATTVANVNASCSPAACVGLPDTASLTVTATNRSGVSDPITGPYTYTVTASLRPEGQTAPCDATVAGCTTPTGTIDPLLALGGTCNAEGVSGLDVGGSTQVDVNGGITLAGGVGGCPASHFHLGSNGSFQSGAITTLGNIIDPFAGLTPPPDTCATSTSNPSPSTGGDGRLHYPPGTYPLALSVPSGPNKNITFDDNPGGTPGIFVFCNGLSISSANTTVRSGAHGVLLYVTGGTFTTSGEDVQLSAPDSGTYKGLLVWQSRTDPNNTAACLLTPTTLCQPMTVTGNGVLSLDGILYAPKTEVILRGNSGTPFVKAIIAASVSFAGTSAITIGTPPPQLFISSPASLPSWTVGVPYPSTPVTASGGSGGNSWTVTGLPNGVTFNPVTNTISGIPTVAGLFSPQIKLVDSDGDVAIAVYSVTINAGLTITGPATLPSADIGRDYPPPSTTAVMTETGGTGPYTWSDGGTLPPGLTIDPASGAISGNPTALGTYTPTITLTDATGATKVKTYATPIVINPLPDITAPTSASLRSWTTGQPGYSEQITVTGGTAPYTWQLSPRPAGLSISSSGLITGTPTSPQTYSMVVTVTDADGVAASQTYSLTINPALSITATVPNGEINIAYTATLTANFGTAPYTWIPSGTLPPGLTLTPGPTTATISGTPTVANSYSVTVTLQDSVGATNTQTYSIVINPAPSIGTSALPSWTVNQDYGTSNTTMSGSGGLTPYTWSDGGTLPPGLTIDPNTGSITGTPNTVGNYPVVITLTDAAGVQATKSFTVAINVLPSISTTSLPDGEVNAPYSTAVNASGGTPFSGGTYKWKISSGPPPGITIDSNTGVISGPPTVSGSFPLTIVVTDAAGATDSVTIAININPPAANQLSLTNQSGGGSFLVGTTVYYRGSTAGSFNITNSISTSGSAVSSNFPALAGTSTGFSHTASVVTSPPGGPFSSTFSWTAGTTSAPTETITGADSFGGTATTTLRFVNDSAAPVPTIGATSPSPYTNSTTPTFSGTAGTQVADATHSADSGTVTVTIYAGPTATGAPLQTFTPSGTTGTWSANPSALAANAQYTVQVTQTDAVGNTGTATKTFVIDTIAPTVTAAMSNPNATKVTVSGTAGQQVADATHSGDVPTVAVAICTAASYTSHSNTCASGWAAFSDNPVAVTGGTYTDTSGNLGHGTYYATVTQSDGAGNVGTVTTGPFTD